MSSIAHKRLMKEKNGYCLIILFILLILVELVKNPVHGIAAGPISDKNIFEWEAFIKFIYLLLFY
jgi:hypothetical protein